MKCPLYKLATSSLNISISDIEVPFPSQREAEIAYNVLRVGSEPKRSQVQKHLSYNNQILSVKFCGEEARQLRVAVNGFMEHLILCTDTIAKFGPPLTDVYSHFN